MLASHRMTTDVPIIVSLVMLQIGMPDRADLKLKTDEFVSNGHPPRDARRELQRNEQLQQRRLVSQKQKQDPQQVSSKRHPVVLVVHNGERNDKHRRIGQPQRRLQLWLKSRHRLRHQCEKLPPQFRPPPDPQCLSLRHQDER